jgi:hypothetical protein
VIAKDIICGPRSIYLVQAFLLLYLWSFPYEIMNKEPSSMYCALAKSMAKSLGLHRPQHPFQFFSAKDVIIGDLENRSRTWLACFIVDLMYAESKYALDSPLTALQAYRQIWCPGHIESRLHGPSYPQLSTSHASRSHGNPAAPCLHHVENLSDAGRKRELIHWTHVSSPPTRSDARY